MKVILGIVVLCGALAAGTYGVSRCGSCSQSSVEQTSGDVGARPDVRVAGPTATEIDQ